MEKHVIKKDQTDTVWIDEGNSEWILQKGVTLGGDAALQNFNFDNVTFTVAGKIKTDGDGILSAGNVDGEAANNTSVTIAASGRILSDGTGVTVEGTDAVIENAGVIRSETQECIWSYADSDITIRNTGKIIAADGRAIFIGDNTEFAIRNDGLISAMGNKAVINAAASNEGKLVNGADGIIEGLLDFTSSEGNVTVINKGSMNGGLSSSNENAVHLGSGDDHLVNKGTITGVIALFDGDDFADLRKGKLVNAEIEGGDGDDVYIIDKANVSISEVDGDGYDTIKTTVSFTLDDVGTHDDIEVVQAIGKKNVNLTGNDQTNVLNGNAANNKLTGGGGNDILWGHGGNDVLTGGLGDADLFYFAAKSGIDTITDFTIDEDEIRLIKITGINDYDDLANRMTTADFNNDNVDDTIVNLGHGNKIRLAGVDKDSLDAGDFWISPIPADAA